MDALFIQISFITARIALKQGDGKSYENDNYEKSIQEFAVHLHQEEKSPAKVAWVISNSYVDIDNKYHDELSIIDPITTSTVVP